MRLRRSSPWLLPGAILHLFAQSKGLKMDNRKCVDLSDEIARLWLHYGLFKHFGDKLESGGLSEREQASYSRIADHEFERTKEIALKLKGLQSWGIVGTIGVNAH